MWNDLVSPIDGNLCFSWGGILCVSLLFFAWPVSIRDHEALDLEYVGPMYSMNTIF
ncbi:hypothetical protein BU24DRAFT_90857 [Aaosphaeria arxii CBS 175.79]|uniref:Uncharacterized protein n=1 Tax=Aaosphaeria arxii CBS 175.79 TaxID=1450172 RepID=A0A6A5X857_9PLEO|nr:uncharacterized protein BU24DRAFT_90857 [Aaosphaeria arxii CBS 175.79]KAF2009110.1 hypothetical protein BU24DRAFT_90857 [Aaosphaeria arxii CBS 175.79]